MSILIPSTEPGVYQEPEIPVTYNQGLEAWEETSGYAFDADAQAWTEAWNQDRTIVVTRSNFFTVLRNDYNGSSNSISFGDSCATIAMHKAMQYYSQPEGLLASKTPVRVKTGDTIIVRYKVNSYSANNSAGAMILVWLSNDTVGSDRTIAGYSPSCVDELHTILFNKNIRRVKEIAVTAVCEKSIESSVPDNCSGDYYINLALIWVNNNNNYGDASVTFYDITIK